MSTAAGRRSHWAWGWEDRLPDLAARRELAMQVGFLLGAADLAIEEPVPLAAVALRRSRLAPPPALAVATGDETRIRHTYGRGYPDLVRGFRGDFATAPDGVATPGSEAELEAILEWCSAAKVAVIPYGGGTSVVGGVEARIDEGAYAGALSLDLARLAGVREVDPVSRAVRVGAGTTGPALESHLAAHGLTLRHYPQSFEFSTVGGWIATRAGGHFATLGTHIDDFVEALRLVTPTGRWQSPRLPASGAGPSPDRLAIGSEGALGVITEAWLRVQPRPRFRAAASLRFADFAVAVAACRDLAQSGLHPANCRLLDGHEALLGRVAFDGRAVLLLGFESADHPLGPWLERAVAIAVAHGGELAKPPELKEARPDQAGAGMGGEGGRWREAFLAAPYLQSSLVSLGVIADTFETACTWDRFAALHKAITEAATAALHRVAGGGLIACRFTHLYPDGPAPYYTFLARGRSGGELEQWREVKEAVSEAIVTVGGTITHHHAVGRLHRPYYDRERPAPFAAALRAAKGALDPAWILNPGVLVDPAPAGAVASAPAGGR